MRVYAVIKNTGYLAEDMRLSMRSRQASHLYGLYMSEDEASQKLTDISLHTHYMESVNINIHEVEVPDDTPLGFWSTSNSPKLRDEILRPIVKGDL